MELNKLLYLLEERLVEHNNNRKEVQGQLQKIYSKMTEEADLLEEKINVELYKTLDPKEERILSLVEQLNGEGNDIKSLVKQAQNELSSEVKYEIQHLENVSSFADSYKLKASPVRVGVKEENNTEEIVNRLQEHLNKIHETANYVRDEMTEICTKRRNEAGELEKIINEKM